MKNIFQRFFKKKHEPSVELGRVIAARFEMNEMAVGVLEIKTYKSRLYWVDWLNNVEHVDFLVVALRLMDEEIDRQSKSGIKPKISVKYPERRQEL